MKIDVDDEPEKQDALCAPANDDHAKRLAALTALAHGGSLKTARAAIALAYGLGRNVGGIEGSSRTAAAWQASIDRAFSQQPSDAAASTAMKREE
jgi:hypothetical protein